MIVSGQLGQKVMPKINHFDNLKGVIVFCLKLSFHREWASNFDKVKVVTSSFKDALNSAKSLLQAAM